MEKINIDNRYFIDEEVKGKSKGIFQYTPFYNVLNEVFDLHKIKNITDVGCREGWLLNIIKESHPDTNILGIDYFDWMKNSSSPLVTPYYHIWDMRDDIMGNSLYEEWASSQDIVISTEVGEHIDPFYSDTYLKNIFKLMTSNGYLVMSWSNVSGDRHGQHLNPLNRSQFFALMSKNGFKLSDLNETFIESCYKFRVESYYLDSNLSLWEKI